MTWQIFRHYLFSRRAGALIGTISKLCVIGTGVGVFALILVLSIMNGFNRSIREKLLAVEPHLLIQAQDNEAVYQDLKKRPSLKVHRYEKQDVIIRSLGGRFSGAVAMGLEKKSLNELFERVSNLKKKNKFVPFDLQPGEVVMGVDLANSLDLFEGEEVVIIPPETLLLPSGEIPYFEKVVVRSVLTTDLPDIDSQKIYYSLGQSLQRLRQSASHEVGTEVRLPTPENYLALQTEFEKKGAAVESWVDRNSILFFALKLEKYAMGSFLGLSALITCFSIITVLVLLITQKRREIGMFMAMGMSPKKARQVFFRIGMYLSVVGMGGGLLTGVLVAYLIDRFPVDMLPDIYYDSNLPAQLDPQMIVVVAVGSMIVAVVASWLPVQAIVKMSPADALKKRAA